MPLVAIIRPDECDHLAGGIAHQPQRLCRFEARFGHCELVAGHVPQRKIEHAAREAQRAFALADFEAPQARVFVIADGFAPQPGIRVVPGAPLRVGST